MIKNVGLILFFLLGCSQIPEKKNAQAEMEAGHALADDHDWAGALKHFERATQKDPGLSVAWSNHGTALLNLGRPEEAMKSYSRARRLDPENPYIYCSMASAGHALGQPQEALRHADQALKVDPGYAPALANKAKALEALGKTEEARRLYQEAFRLKPELKRHFITKLL